MTNEGNPTAHNITMHDLQMPVESVFASFVNEMHRPMVPLQALAEMLTESDLSPEEQREMLGRIQECASQVSRMLDWAKDYLHQRSLINNQKD
ncbi:MAG: hypothetical protein JNJ61_08990 [Anaerolineae bacterium]|nr:hypothetical protein [Anaerolineae bacterium]